VKFFSIFGGNRARPGHWPPGDKCFVLSLLGGTDIDLRETDLPGGEVELTAVSFLGGATVLVPPGVSIRSSAVGLFGGVNVKRQPSAEEWRGSLHVKGVAILGGITVETRAPEA
jgi:hypothetical protein